MRNCIVYHYYEKDETYKDNFNHFLIFGIDDTNDYCILLSGNCSVDIPVHKKNIKVYLFENFNLDYGAYCKLIKSGLEVLNYDFIFFINSSVRGPYIPPYMAESWTNMFINLFDSKVGAVGSTINVLNPSCNEALHYKNIYNQTGVSHIQTTAYCLSRESLLFLIDCGFYNEDAELDKLSVISKYEIRMSQLLINKGLRIKSVCPEYNRIDFLKEHSDPNPTSGNGDILVENGYWGRAPHPYEVIFIKTNRNIINLDYIERLSLSMLMSKLNAENEFGKNHYISKIIQSARSNKKINMTPPTLELGEFLNLIKNLSKSNGAIKKLMMEQLVDNN
jgi:hypothetical protein